MELAAAAEFAAPELGADVGLGLGADAAFGGLDAAAFSAAPLAETAVPLTGGLGAAEAGALFAPEASAFAAPLDTSLLASGLGAGFGGAGIGGDLLSAGAFSPLAADAGLGSVPGLSSVAPIGLSQPALPAGAISTGAGTIAPAGGQGAFSATEALNQLADPLANLPTLGGDTGPADFASRFAGAPQDVGLTPQDLASIPTTGPGSPSGFADTAADIGAGGATSGQDVGAAKALADFGPTPVNTSGAGSPPAGMTGAPQTSTFSPSPAGTPPGGAALAAKPPAPAGGGGGGGGFFGMSPGQLALGAIAATPLGITLARGEPKLPQQSYQAAALAPQEQAFAASTLQAVQNNQPTPSQQAVITQDRESLLNQWKQTLMTQEGVTDPEQDTRWPQIVAMVDKQMLVETQQFIKQNFDMVMAAGGAASTQLANLGNSISQSQAEYTDAVSRAAQSLGVVTALGLMNSGRQQAA